MWFRKKRKTVNPMDQLFTTEISVDRSNYQQVLSASYGKVLVQQKKFEALLNRFPVGEANFFNNTLTIGNERYTIEYLGSESEISDTWLWGWESDSGYDASLLTEAYRLKAFAEAYNLEPFKVNQFELTNTLNGEYIATAAVGLLGDQYCYYRYPLERGNAYVLIRGLPEAIFSPIDAEAFRHIVKIALENPLVEPKRMIVCFLHHNKCTYTMDDSKIEGKFLCGTTLRFYFDSENEVTTLLRIDQIT